MKRILPIFLLLLVTTFASAQTMKSHTVGHPVTISIPDYMNRTIGINSGAIIQYKSEVKGVYGFVIEDNKEELKMAEIHFSSLTEFYDDFIKDFSKDEEKVKQSKPVIQTKGNTTFLEADFSYYDKDAKEEVYYLVGMVETPTSYYQVLTYCSLADKVKFKEDFRKILYSLKD